jgi:hypothetical protein
VTLTGASSLGGQRPQAPVHVPLIFLVALCGLQIAMATGLATSATGVGSGTGVVSPCDGDGFVFGHTIDSSGRIATVTTSGIHATCAGGTLRLTLVNGSSSVGSGSVTLPSSGFTGSADVAINPQPLSTAVTAVYASVEGP